MELLSNAGVPGRGKPAETAVRLIRLARMQRHRSQCSTRPLAGYIFLMFLCARFSESFLNGPSISKKKRSSTEKKVKMRYYTFEKIACQTRFKCTSGLMVKCPLAMRTLRVRFPAGAHEYNNCFAPAFFFPVDSFPPLRVRFSFCSLAFARTVSCPQNGWPEPDRLVNRGII